MSSALDKSTQQKLWIIFGFFILIIIGLLSFQVVHFMKAKSQRENVEELRKAQTKFINSTILEQQRKDSSATK